MKTNFFGQVYEIVKKIPIGKVMTYGQVARVLGTRDARKVGWALHGNKDPDCPCHRVVNKDGGVALNYARPQRLSASDGGQAFEGWEEQKRKLVAEGVEFMGETHVDLIKYRVNFVDWTE